MAINTPLINGFRYSWSSISASVGDFELSGFTSIKYKSSVDRGEARGAGRQLYGFTEGDVKHEASFEMLAEDWYDFRSTLAQLGPYLDQSFDIVINYDQGGVTHVDKIVGCLIKDVDHDHSRGTDALKVKIDLNVTYIIEDGDVSPFNGFSE